MSLFMQNEHNDFLCIAMDGIHNSALLNVTCKLHSFSHVALEACAIIQERSSSTMLLLASVTNSLVLR